MKIIPDHVEELRELIIEVENWTLTKQDHDFKLLMSALVIVAGEMMHTMKMPEDVMNILTFKLLKAGLKRYDNLCEEFGDDSEG